MGKRSTSGALVAAVTAVAFAWLASAGSAGWSSGPPAAGQQYPKKVTICHRTKSKKKPYVTIRVSRNAVRAHLRHGDKVGSCTTATFPVCHKAKGRPAKTVKVKGSKVRGHLKHGDKRGPCKKGKKPGKGKAKPKDEDRGKGKPKKDDDKGKGKDKPKKK